MILFGGTNMADRDCPFCKNHPEAIIGGAHAEDCPLSKKRQTPRGWLCVRCWEWIPGHLRIVREFFRNQKLTLCPDCFDKWREDFKLVRRDLMYDGVWVRKKDLPKENLPDETA